MGDFLRKVEWLSLREWLELEVVEFIFKRFCYSKLKFNSLPDYDWICHNKLFAVQICSSHQLQVVFGGREIHREEVGTGFFGRRHDVAHLVALGNELTAEEHAALLNHLAFTVIGTL